MKVWVGLAVAKNLFIGYKMKLETLNQDMKSRGVVEKYDYEVVQNAKMMTLLSDSLYSDKVLAPVRELSTNAWDSHIVAGKTDIPFDAQIPTRAKPEFRIRDYGTGMSKQKMVDMYRKYGASDKNQTNDLQGCMGLGSKSPFAYTDLFIATTFYNGIKYVYANGKDRNGFTLNLVYEGSTSEPNGFEVKFSVDKGDIHLFQNAMHEVYQYFPVKPNVVNGTITIDKPTYLRKGEGWTIEEREYRGYGRNSNSDSVAIMGLIAYPIESRHFPKHSKLLGNKIVMEFGIGEVEMDISRESLQYSDRTIKNISDKLDMIYGEVKASIDEDIQKAECYWDACQVSRDILGVSTTLGIQLEYKGRKINNTYTSTTISGEWTLQRMRYDEYKHRVCTSRKGEIDYRGGEKVVFIENDGRGTMKRVEHWLNKDANKDKTVHFFRFKEDNVEQEFLDKVGILKKNVVKGTSLDKVTSTSVSSRKPKNHVNVFNLTDFITKLAANPVSGYRSYYRKDEWAMSSNFERQKHKSTIDADSKDKVFYITLYRHEVSGLANMKVKNAVAAIKTFEQFTDDTIVSLYGITQKDEEKVKDKKNWINLIDYLSKTFEKLSKTHKKTDKVNLDRELNSLYEDVYNRQGGFDTTKVFHKEMEALDNKVNMKGGNVIPNKMMMEIDRFLSDCTSSDVRCLFYSQDKADTEVHYDAVIAAYPMLSVLGRFINSDDAKTARDYIKFIDNV